MKNKGLRKTVSVEAANKFRNSSPVELCGRACVDGHVWARKWCLKWVGLGVLLSGRAKALTLNFGLQLQG